MKRKTGNKRQLLAFWALLTVAVFGCMVLILSLSGLLGNAEESLSDSLTLRLESARERLQSDLDELTAQSLRLSKAVSAEVENLLVRTGKSFSELNDDPELLRELQLSIYGPVSGTLQVSRCSGAYAVLDVTANTKVEGNSRSGLYLRCINFNGGSPVHQHISFFRGIPDVARQKNLELHNRWNMELDVDSIPGYGELVSREFSRPAEYYYWTERVSIKDTWEEVQLLCVPIVGDDKTVYGVCGVDVSALLFQLDHPAADTEFGTVTTVLAPLEDGKLMLPKGLIGGTGGTELDRPEALAIHRGSHFSTYEGETGRYVGMQQTLHISQEDHSYRQWVAALLLPEKQYERYAVQNLEKQIFLCAGLLLGLLGFSALLYWQFLHSVQPEPQTSDTLVNFVRKTPPQLLSCGELPTEIHAVLDGFLSRAAELPPEERRLLQLLADGCEPEGLRSKTGLRKRVLTQRLQGLCTHLDVRTAEDILLYLDIFRRCGRQEELRNL